VPLGKRYRSIAVAVLWVWCSRQQAVVLSSKCEQRTPGFVNVHESPGIKKSNFPGPGKSWNRKVEFPGPGKSWNQKVEFSRTWKVLESGFVV